MQTANGGTEGEPAPPERDAKDAASRATRTAVGTLRYVTLRQSARRICTTARHLICSVLVRLARGRHVARCAALQGLAASALCAPVRRGVRARAVDRGAGPWRPCVRAYVPDRHRGIESTPFPPPGRSGCHWAGARAARSRAWGAVSPLCHLRTVWKRELPLPLSRLALLLDHLVKSPARRYRTTAEAAHHLDSTVVRCASCIGPSTYSA